MIQLSVLDAETVDPESDVELDDPESFFDPESFDAESFDEDESFFDPDSFEDDEFELALSFL